MKTRIVAGLVASLALFTSASAGAAPKKHSAKHPPKHASVTTSVTAAASAPQPSSADQAAATAAAKPGAKHASAKRSGGAAATAKHASLARAKGAAASPKHASSTLSKSAASSTKHASSSSAKSAASSPKQASVTIPAEPPAAATRPASLTTSVASAKEPATRPAALTTKPAAKPARKAKVHHGKKKRHADAAATRPASLVTEVAASQPAPRHPTRPAALVTPEEPGASRADELHHDGAHARLAPPKRSRFLASGVPLAEIQRGRIQSVASAKHPCGLKTTWARKNSEWTALDEWGQPVPDGGATIADSRFYDGSGCYEVQLKTACLADEAAHVYVARGSGYTAGPSARWNAEPAAIKRFDRLYATQTSAWVEGGDRSGAAKSGDEARGRTLFFSLPKQEGSVEGAPTQRRPIHWAVAGGRVLVVGYVSATGAWKVGHVLPPNGKEHAYEPLAVLDMNGDGLPEIVVHEESGGVYVDRVLSFDPGTMRWEKAVDSPGGATN